MKQRDGIEQLGQEGGRYEFIGAHESSAQVLAERTSKAPVVLCRGIESSSQRLQLLVERNQGLASPAKDGQHCRAACNRVVRNR